MYGYMLLVLWMDWIRSLDGRRWRWRPRKEVWSRRASAYQVKLERKQIVRGDVNSVQLSRCWAR